MQQASILWSCVDYELQNGKKILQMVQGGVKQEPLGSQIFHFSDAEDLCLKRRASVMLGEKNKEQEISNIADSMHLRQRL